MPKTIVFHRVSSREKIKRNLLPKTKNEGFDRNRKAANDVKSKAKRNRRERNFVCVGFCAEKMKDYDDKVILLQYLNQHST